jgi:hypothetical protein
VSATDAVHDVVVPTAADAGLHVTLTSVACVSVTSTDVWFELVACWLSPPYEPVSVCVPTEPEAGV